MATFSVTAEVMVGLCKRVREKVVRRQRQTPPGASDVIYSAETADHPEDILEMISGIERAVEQGRAMAGDDQFQIVLDRKEADLLERLLAPSRDGR